jgi:uncharacterized LabA/DUF88 family protein
MTEPWEADRNLAMLIDGDNAQHTLLAEMIDEVSRYGNVTVRRAYGDWTQQNLAYWRPEMLAHAIQPIQQWRYTTGKNATDSALIIDAMDILYSGTVHGFCIVSSDSDYTRLATRIRESGLFVMGIGRTQTPDAFIKSCHVFVRVENLIKIAELPLDDQVQVNSNSSDGNALFDLIHRAFEISAREDGWAELGALGNALHRLDPSFDHRTYGYKSLSHLVNSQPEQFTVKGTKKEGPSSIYVHLEDSSEN